MPELAVLDTAERDDIGAFVARAVRLERECAVRLRKRSESHVDVWVATPFDVLATRMVAAELEPDDITVYGNELLAALAVVRGDRVDPGPPRDLLWRTSLPPTTGWSVVDELPGKIVAGLADEGLAVARANPGPRGTPPAALLDQEVLTVAGAGYEVKIPLRCLFALSGMGFLGGGDDVEPEPVRVSATDSWLRMDAHFGAVVRRRHALLPLLF